MQLHLVFICALLSFTQPSQAQLSSDLFVCESNYWWQVSCFLDFRAIPNRTENTTYHLEFQVQDYEKKTCLLSVEKDGYSCIFTAELNYGGTFADYHEIDISLCDPQSCKLLKSNFSPAQHIKPITPYNLTVQYENRSYNFEWNSGYEKHPYRSVLSFEYVLRYHPVGQTTVKELHTEETVYNILETVLDPGTEYVASVYNTVRESGMYKGTPSHGSAEIRWKTQPASPADGEITMKQIAILTCLAVGLLSLLLFPVARMKIKKISWVETPAPYVSPMNPAAQYWLSKGHVQYSYSEEISKIDMITENTPRQQVQERSSIVYSHCHTPYVSPLKGVWPPCLTPDSRIAANNACTDLDFLPDDHDVEKTLLCLGTAEGCVSLDDLEPSPEVYKSSEASSLPANPVCFNQSYCTLTNTEMGLIPTFCSVQGAPSLDLGLMGTTTPEPLNIQIEENTLAVDTVTLDNLQLSIED